MAFAAVHEHTAPRRARGLALIVGYKAVKAPLMLALAVVLTLNPEGTLHALERAARELNEGGALLGKLAHFIDAHLTRRAIGRGAVLAWLDGLTTSLEAFLLWRGKAWGEWLVVVGLAALVPFELDAVIRHPTALRSGAAVLNALVVAYLVRLRLTARRSAAAPSVPPPR
jgi:uncharacterized membrane protein (DUF2068 family)